MKKCFCIMLLLAVIGGTSLFAQNTGQQDSLAKLAQDSLNKAAQTNAVDSVPSAKPAKVKKDTRPMSQRISFGVNTSFWANPGNTYFEFSPIITYHFPKTWSIGAGPTYVYNHDKGSNIDLHGWGGKVYGMASLTSWLYGWTEYQGISNQHVTGFDANTNKFTKSNWYVDSWFLSLGLNLPLGRRNINLQVLYDVLYKESTSYTYSPVTYRIGFGF